MAKNFKYNHLPFWTEKETELLLAYQREGARGPREREVAAKQSWAQREFGGVRNLPNTPPPDAVGTLEGT